MIAVLLLFNARRAVIWVIGGSVLLMNCLFIFYMYIHVGTEAAVQLKINTKGSGKWDMDDGSDENLRKEFKKIVVYICCTLPRRLLKFLKGAKDAESKKDMDEGSDENIRKAFKKIAMAIFFTLPRRLLKHLKGLKDAESKKVLRVVWGNGGVHHSAIDTLKLFLIADTDGNGSLEKCEFLETVASCRGSSQNKDALKPLAEAIWKDLQKGKRGEKERERVTFAELGMWLNVAGNRVVLELIWLAGAAGFTGKSEFLEIVAPRTGTRDGLGAASPARVEGSSWEDTWNKIERNKGEDIWRKICKRDEAKVTFKELLNWLNVPKNPKEETFSEVIGESGLSSLRGICHTQDEDGVRKLKKSTVLDVIQNFDFSDEIGHHGLGAHSEQPERRSCCCCLKRARPLGLARGEMKTSVKNDVLRCARSFAGRFYRLDNDSQRAHFAGQIGDFAKHIITELGTSRLVSNLVDVIFVLSLVAKNPEVQQVGPNWDKILPDFFYLDSAPWSLKEVCPTIVINKAKEGGAGRGLPDPGRADPKDYVPTEVDLRESFQNFGEIREIRAEQWTEEEGPSQHGFFVWLRGLCTPGSWHTPASTRTSTVMWVAFIKYATPDGADSCRQASEESAPKRLQVRENE